MRGFSLFTTLICGSALFLLAADKPKLPEAPGKAATVRLCGSCHAAEIVMSRRESRDGWSGVVEDMIQRGAKGSDDEFGEVVDYLVAQFPKGAPVPKVNVNKADADDIVAGLGVSNTHAAAIVKYREEKGDFKSIETCKKSPASMLTPSRQRKTKSNSRPSA